MLIFSIILSTVNLMDLMDLFMNMNLTFYARAARVSILRRGARVLKVYITLHLIYYDLILSY